MVFDYLIKNLLDQSEKRSLVFMSGDVEPWSIRGGLAGQFLVC
jgi:hypothetical protein